MALSLEQPRSLSLLVGGFAVVALVLSIVGIYGVMAYYVQQHLKDISIRLALGGSPARCAAAGRGSRHESRGDRRRRRPAHARSLLARLMSSLLFGVGAADAFTFATAAVLLLGVALVACSVPGRRAVVVEPAAVLRNE